MALIALLEFITNLDQMLSPVCEVRMWSNTRAEKASPDRLLFLDEKDEKKTMLMSFFQTVSISTVVCSVVDNMGSVSLDGGEFKMLPLWIRG